MRLVFDEIDQSKRDMSFQMVFTTSVPQTLNTYVCSGQSQMALAECVIFALGLHRYVVSRGLEDEASLLALFVTELVSLVHESRAKGAAEATEEDEDHGGALLLLPGYQVLDLLSICLFLYCTAVY